MTARRTNGASSKKGKGIGMSPETAELVWFWSNVALVGGLAIGVIATACLVISGNIKEEALKRDVASAGEEIARANEAAATANERAAALEKEAADARLELERLRERLAGRRLSDEQYTRLVNEFVALKNIKIILSAISTDPESMIFADDFRNALKRSGQDFEFRPSLPIAPRPIVGIILKATTENLPRIVEALNRAEVRPFEGRIWQRTDDIEIFIGSKPPVQ